MSKTINKSLKIVLPIISVLILTGCNVEPQPFSKNELKKHINNELLEIDKTLLPIKGKISLEEAIERGVTYNRQKKVAIMEAALSQNQLDLIEYDMLAQLTTKAGYSKRDNYAASASTAFTNGTPDPLDSNPSYSVSQDKKSLTADVSFSWNILDFGLSYVRAQQSADKYLIAKEKIRKVTQNITQEIRRSYFQALAAENLLKNITPIMKEVRLALQDSQKINKLKLESPINALNYQSELINILRSLYEVERKLIRAKIDLARLMGLKPGTKYWLAEYKYNKYDIPKFDLDFKEMEQIALRNRAELIQSRYEERISKKEIDTVMLKMLPGISLNAGVDYNDSDYLLNNDWLSYGATASWNLLNVFKYSSLKDVANSKHKLAKEKKLALSMAVLSQVHLSYVSYMQSLREYKISKEYLEIKDEVLKEIELSNRFDTSNKLILIKEKLNHLLATLRHSSAYADLQNNYGRLFNSMGIEVNLKE